MVAAFYASCLVKITGLGVLCVYEDVLREAMQCTLDVYKRFVDRFDKLPDFELSDEAYDRVLDFFRKSNYYFQKANYIYKTAEPGILWERSNRGKEENLWDIADAICLRDKIKEVNANVCCARVLGLENLVAGMELLMMFAG